MLAMCRKHIFQWQTKGEPVKPGYGGQIETPGAEWLSIRMVN